MKAIVYERYGSPEVLELRHLKRPTPKESEVLIKVFATTVTAGDWRMRKADPFLVRIFNGLFKPRKVKVLGFELAGIIEEVGNKVKDFKKGDSVFAHCGMRFGAYAQYTCLPVNDMIAIKPYNLSYGEAAALPVGGLTALRLLKQINLKKDDKIMIYGASGSVGSYATQIANTFGANVTAVCSTGNLSLVKHLGAHKVIDYTKEELSKIPEQFDFIFDAVGKMSKPALRHLLKPEGKFISVKSKPKSGEDDLLTLKRLVEAGSVFPVIDRTYSLEQIREAHKYVESFRKKGNVIIKVFQQ